MLATRDIIVLSIGFVAVTVALLIVFSSPVRENTVVNNSIGLHTTHPI